MPISGVIILIFLVFHIYHFRLQKESLHNVHGEADLYSVVTSLFVDPRAVVFYVLSMICLGLHLAHAFQSSLRTLGLTQPTYLLWARRLSISLAAFFVVSFSAFPVYFLANQPKPGVNGYEEPWEHIIMRDTEEQIKRISTPAPAAPTAPTSPSTTP
jgi:succinate dehydrogenase/fumarate reductase cytochrome b subunit (b558 family)